MDGGGAAAAASLARAGSIRSQQSSSLEHPRKNSSIEIIKQAREEYSRYNNSGGGGSSILKKQPAPTLPNKRRYNSDIDNESAEEIDMRWLRDKPSPQQMTWQTGRGLIDSDWNELKFMVLTTPRIYPFLSNMN